MGERTTTRALIRVHGRDKRSRGSVVDGLIGYTDDGYVHHIPSGLAIGPPPGLEVANDAKFVRHLLDADPDAWEATRGLGDGERPPPEVSARLLAARDSYPGD